MIRSCIFAMVATALVNSCEAEADDRCRAMAAPTPVTNVRVIDGDTLAGTVEGRGALRIRIAGIDAPELRGQCISEIIQANNAATALRTAIEVSQTVMVQSQGCGMPAGEGK